MGKKHTKEFKQEVISKPNNQNTHEKFIRYGAQMEKKLKHWQRSIFFSFFASF